MCSLDLLPWGINVGSTTTLASVVKLLARNRAAGAKLLPDSNPTPPLHPLPMFSGAYTERLASVARI